MSATRRCIDSYLPPPDRQHVFFYVQLQSSSGVGVGRGEGRPSERKEKSRAQQKSAQCRMASAQKRRYSFSASALVMGTPRSSLALLVVALLATCAGALRLDASLFAPFIRIAKNEQRTRDMLILRGALPRLRLGCFLSSLGLFTFSQHRWTRAQYAQVLRKASSTPRYQTSRPVRRMRPKSLRCSRRALL